MGPVTKSVTSERKDSHLAAYGVFLWLSKVHPKGGTIEDVLKDADEVFARAKRTLMNPNSSERKGAQAIAEMWSYLSELSHRKYAQLQVYVDKYHSLIKSSPLCEPTQ